MKKTLLLIAVALFVSSTAFSQFKFGAGVSVGTKAGIGVDGTKINFGLNVRADYTLSDDLAITGGFTYYLPTKYTTTTTTAVEMKNTAFGFNADIKYYLMNDDTKVYGLGGLNWISNKTTIAGIGIALTQFGWEVGGGVEFGKIFVEAKYDGNTLAKQIVATVGLYF
jgi:hypothetical protein